MNDSITTENKSILVKRTLTLSIYGESSNAGPLYLNHLVNLDFFDRISAEDQAGLLMEESTVGVKDSSGDDRRSFLRLTDYLHDQGAMGMITNLQSGMTLFLKPSGHCRAQMYSLSLQFLKTWCLLSARRIAAESEAARIAAQIEATRIAAEVEAARIAAKIEADRIAAEVEAARIAAVIASTTTILKPSVSSVPAHSPPQLSTQQSMMVNPLLLDVGNLPEGYIRSYSYRKSHGTRALSSQECHLYMQYLYTTRKRM
jgi:hypothetical protein